MRRTLQTRIMPLLTFATMVKPPVSFLSDIAYVFISVGLLLTLFLLDYIGGHIKGSTNVPAHQLDAMMPTLLRRLNDKKIVVFHCMLSQQRGPKAARRYMQEREAALGKEAADQQTVYVLGRGFDGWQQEYKNDERLTEGFRKDLWENA